MKVYELIQNLANYPAEAEIKFNALIGGTDPHLTEMRIDVIDNTILDAKAYILLVEV